MSLAIQRSGLTKEQETFISKHLTLVPVRDDFMSKKFNFQPKSNDGTVQFWKAEKDVVHLPLLFASAMFKKYPDPNTYPNAKMTFTGMLIKDEKKDQPAAMLEAWGHLQQFGTTTLSLYTGFGKTALGACAACALGKVVLITFTMTTLMKQWADTFRKFTTARIWVYGECPRNEVPHWSEDTTEPPVDVIICMVERVPNIPKHIRDQVGTLILDEAHLLCVPSAVPMFMSLHPCYIIAETATLERDDDMHSMIVAVAGSHSVYRESKTPFNVFKVETNTTPDTSLNKLEGAKGWLDRETNVTQNLRRLTIISQLATHAYPEDAVLILTRHVPHAKAIAAMLRSNGIDVQEYHSDMTSFKECRVLVGTVSKIGTGFDQESQCSNFSGRRFRILIIASSIKKKTQVVQCIGRVIFRCQNPVVLHLVDNYKTYKGHWREVEKIYKSRNGIIQKISIPNPNNE